MEKKKPQYYAEYIKKLQNKPVEDILISELPLSTRAKDRLIYSVGVINLNDLLRKNLEDLYGFKNFGPITINEITDVLKDLGFSLHQRNEHEKEKTLPRKIIQIATGTYFSEIIGEKRASIDWHILYALCDDGSIFYYKSITGEWLPLHSIPQPEKPTKILNHE